MCESVKSNGVEKLIILTKSGLCVRIAFNFDFISGNGMNQHAKQTLLSEQDTENNIINGAKMAVVM
jgi:hypothetical protein